LSVFNLARARARAFKLSRPLTPSRVHASALYGVATIIRLLNIIGLFCRISSLV